MRVANGCGTTSASDVAYFADCNQRTYTVYPNPADDNLTVEQTDSTSGPGPQPRPGRPLHQRCRCRLQHFQRP